MCLCFCFYVGFNYWYFMYFCHQTKLLFFSVDAFCVIRLLILVGELILTLRLVRNYVGLCLCLPFPTVELWTRHLSSSPIVWSFRFLDTLPTGYFAYDLLRLQDISSTVTESFTDPPASPTTHPPTVN